ncbi:hypothetical protein ACOXY6_14710 [Cytophagales bacterium EPR-FJ-38]
MIKNDFLIDYDFQLQRSEISLTHGAAVGYCRSTKHFTDRRFTGRRWVGLPPQPSKNRIRPPSTALQTQQQLLNILCFLEHLASLHLSESQIKRINRFHGFFSTERNGSNIFGNVQ